MGISSNGMKSNADHTSEQDIGDQDGSIKDPGVYNAFLSNFAMMNLWHFDSENVDVEKMMDFITRWLSRTRTTGYIEWGDWPRISLDNLNLFMEGFTGLTFSEEDAVNNVPNGQYYFYDGGYFYRKLGDGESTTDFCVVKDVRESDDGNLEVDFSVFSIDLNHYFEYNDSIDNYFYMNYEDASNCGTLNEIGYGTAIIRPVVYGMFPFHFLKFDCVTGSETQTTDADQSSDSETQAEKSDVIDLALYLHTDIYKFKDAVGDMTDVHASDGTEFSNDSIIVGAPYVESEITFFDLRGDHTSYSILGIECGMDYDAAINSINDKIDRLTSSEGNITYFDLNNGNQLRVDNDENGLVSHIDIWSDRTGIVKEWPGWQDGAASTGAVIDSDAGEPR